VNTTNESTGLRLVWPAAQHLDSYIAALEQGWSPNNVDPKAGRADLQAIAGDAEAFLAGMIDREARLPDIVLPDGTRAKRLPGFRKWIWDGEFCGVIGLRWQWGTNELPPHVLGHIGFAVVPWKRRRGYATRALSMLLPEAKAEGLSYVELTANVDNVASRRVIEANGGRMIEQFRKPEFYGGGESYRFRIDL
jgi:predicted acetyltransferase